jgi:hypothetical protein
VTVVLPLVPVTPTTDRGAVGELVETLRHAGEHRARIGHLDERDLGRRMGGNPLGHDGRGPAAHGLVDET